MLIGILQAGHLAQEVQAGHGDYVRLYSELLAGHGLRFQGWNVVDMEFPISIDAADGWLISGSRHGAYEDLPFIPRLETFIREAHAAEKPMIGICFGHQLIAKALGGRVEKFDGGWMVGRKDYMLDGMSYALNAWHQDQVLKAPAGARVIGSAPGCKIAALAYGDTILTMQPHPEFPNSVLTELLDHRAKGIVPVDRQNAARAMLDQPNDNARIGQKLARFFVAHQQVDHG
ncbi:glutamine amidotransferase [Actibacterium mucosum KCTC 23349]|uniref:Glutamine amidotransferase n=1 Tax=Actibacterium mucosum KCTC 23349 TaxID=1454373 RepID=A0A037ZCC9_9RHOB|nr:type 1 glutamine amidotransferase [Actibacterium mucosum]KAJ54164.1 glutamine amidotransferase [Actibacterium mucosum KCTC 23349]